MDQLSPSNSYSVALCASHRSRARRDDQIEYRLRIAGRGRHRLQHVDGRGLMLDPLAVFAVARGQCSVAQRVPRQRGLSCQRRVALCPQRRDDGVKSVVVSSGGAVIRFPPSRQSSPP